MVGVTQFAFALYYVAALTSRDTSWLRGAQIYLTVDRPRS